jgi:hypothetical protein
LVAFTCFLLAFINFIGYMRARADRDRNGRVEKRKNKGQKAPKKK